MNVLLWQARYLILKEAGDLIGPAMDSEVLSLLLRQGLRR